MQVDRCMAKASAIGLLALRSMCRGSVDMNQSRRFSTFALTIGQKSKQFISNFKHSVRAVARAARDLTEDFLNRGRGPSFKPRSEGPPRLLAWCPLVVRLSLASLII